MSRINHQIHRHNFDFKEIVFGVLFSDFVSKLLAPQCVRETGNHVPVIGQFVGPKNAIRALSRNEGLGVLELFFRTWFFRFHDLLLNTALRCCYSVFCSVKEFPPIKHVFGRNVFFTHQSKCVTTADLNYTGYMKDEVRMTFKPYISGMMSNKRFRPAPRSENGFHISEPMSHFSTT